MAPSRIYQEPHSSSKTSSKHSKMNSIPAELEEQLTRLNHDFWISGTKLKEIVSCFREELDEGLKNDNGQNIPMNISWVHSLPTGREKGTIITLDLGGTNLRVCKVTLKGDGAKGKDKSTLDQEQYKVPENLKTSDAETLWNFVIEKLEDFLKSRNLHEEYSHENPVSLGFTFSYPATQSHIDHAVLQTWTKGFDISGVEGEDVAQQLRTKIEERKLPVELICVINDTVGAMIASAYNDPATIIGAIFGTGCNAAYMASLSDVTKLDPNDERIVAAHTNRTQSVDPRDRKMAINCEYGAFDNAHRVLPRTKYDEKIDADSPRPGEQTFEKLSAGLYLGEMYRLVLVDLIEQGLLFKGQNTEILKKSYSLDTGFLSDIEQNETYGLQETRDLFAEKLGLRPSDVEIEVSRRIAEMIAARGARLCACGVAAICLKEGITEGNVAADGSVANKHPKFKKRWAKALGEILDWEDKEAVEGPIRMTSAEDGSGIGCAIIAAMELERRGESSQK